MYMKHHRGKSWHAIGLEAQAHFRNPKFEEIVTHKHIQETLNAVILLAEGIDWAASRTRTGHQINKFHRELEAKASIQTKETQDN